MSSRLNGSDLAWQWSLAAVAGVTFSVVLLFEPPSVFRSISWGFTFVLLAGLGSWLRVAIEPYGTIDLSPIIFLPSAAVFGLSDAFMLAVIAPLCGFLIHRLLSSAKTSLLGALTDAGEAAVSLSFGAVWIASARTGEPLLDLLQLSALTFGALVGLRAVRVAATEGVSLRRLMGPLARRATPHYAVMLVTVPIIWLVSETIGLLGVALSVVVLVEAYYPWKLLGEQRDLFLRSLQMMSNAVDVKDPYTAHHSRRVASTSVMLARTLGVPEDEVARVRIGALMHDIGKIAVPGRIIRKPSKLSGDEMDSMKSHVRAGEMLIQDLEILQKSKDIVRHHHENFDGSGYPDGLAREAIPLGARIVFVADAFDALTTDRPYRKGRSHSEALEVIRSNAGTQFDPKVVDVLGKIGDRVRTVHSSR